MANITKATICDFQRREGAKGERGLMVSNGEDILVLFDANGLIVEELVFQYLMRPDLGELEIKGFRPPYREFCRHPDKCDGKGSCPRDPTCAD